MALILPWAKKEALAGDRLPYRALIDDKSEQVKEAGPSTPVEVLGFTGVPSAGDRFSVVTNNRQQLRFSNGARLLQRSTRRLSLTEAGQAYLERVRGILQEIDEAHAATSASTRELSGLLRLHASPVIASQVVAPLLSGFRQRYPRIHLDKIREAYRGIAELASRSGAGLASRGHQPFLYYFDTPVTAATARSTS